MPRITLCPLFSVCWKDSLWSNDDLVKVSKFPHFFSSAVLNSNGLPSSGKVGSLCASSLPDHVVAWTSLNETKRC